MKSVSRETSSLAADSAQRKGLRNVNSCDISNGVVHLMATAKKRRSYTVRNSGIHGRGVFATEKIRKGAVKNSAMTTG